MDSIRINSMKNIVLIYYLTYINDRYKHLHKLMSKKINGFTLEMFTKRFKIIYIQNHRCKLSLQTIKI